VEIDVAPSQPDEVVEAIARVLAEPDPAPDPWWRAGLEEALEE
jgi:hypothetical protein